MQVHRVRIRKGIWGRVWSNRGFVTMQSTVPVPPSTRHCVKLVHPLGEKFLCRGKQRYIHSILLEKAHNRYLIWHVYNSLMSRDVRIFVLRILFSNRPY